MHHLRGIRLLNNSVLSKNSDVYKLIVDLRFKLCTCIPDVFPSQGANQKRPLERRSVIFSQEMMNVSHPIAASKQSEMSSHVSLIYLAETNESECGKHTLP